MFDKRLSPEFNICGKSFAKSWWNARLGLRVNMKRWIYASYVKELYVMHLVFMVMELRLTFKSAVLSKGRLMKLSSVLGGDKKKCPFLLRPPDKTPWHDDVSWRGDSKIYAGCT